MTSLDATNLARDERAALCDLLTELGPDQPTLCTGWQTRDLAAHLVVRERRPDAAAGLIVKPLRGHLARVQTKAASRPYEQLVDQVRRPPLLSMSRPGPLDRLINTQEFFIHLEDVRRAQPDWQPRPLNPAMGTALWTQLRRAARFALRRFPATVILHAPEYGEIRIGAGGPEVRVTGDPGEVVLFLSGRQRVARVELDGPEELTTRLRKARLGV